MKTRPFESNTHISHAFRQLLWLIPAFVALLAVQRAEARNLVAFYVEMTRPDVPGPYTSDPDFIDCFFDELINFPVANPNKATGGVKVFDDTFDAIVTFRDDFFWQESATDPGMGRLMTVQGIETATEMSMFTRTSKAGGGVHYPAFFGLSQDGGFRPFLPNETTVNALSPANQTIRVGPLAYDSGHERAYADVETVTYDPTTRSLTLTFRGGGTTKITILESIPTRVLLRVDLDDGPSLADVVVGQMFEITSMFVSETTNDVAKVRWTSAEGVVHEENVMDFQDSEVVEITLFRDAHSDHNTIGPDMRVFDFEYDNSPGTPGTVLVKQLSFETDCAEMDNVVLGFLPAEIPQTSANGVSDSWTYYYNLASQYYYHYAGFGYTYYAWSFYFYFRALGDYEYDNAFARYPEALFSYYAGLGSYSYYYYVQNGDFSLAYLYYYYYQAFGYYYFFLSNGDPASANFYYSYFMDVAYSNL